MPTMYDETMIPSKRVDAKEGLDWVCLPADIDAALATWKRHGYGKNDPENFSCCVLAEGGKRMYGTAKVTVGHRTAYVVHPGEKHSTRYSINRGDSEAVEAWDEFIDGKLTEKQLRKRIGEGIKIRFNAPSKGRKLEAMRKNYKKNKDRYRKNTKRNQRKGVSMVMESVHRDGLRVNRKAAAR